MKPLARSLARIKQYCPDWQHVGYASIVTLSILSAIVFLRDYQTQSEADRALENPFVETHTIYSEWH